MTDSVVVKEYSDGTNWYKIYQSGLLEQGTKIYSGSPSQTINLPVNYADTNYTVNISNVPQYNPQKFYKSKQALMTYTNITTTMKENVLPSFSYEVKSENQFEVTSDVSRAKYEWFTKGYIKSLEYKTFSINPTPSDATVIINGIEQNNIQYPCGKYLTYTVKKDGYQTITNTVTITDDLTIDVNLEVELYSYTIKPTPSDAIVIINGIQQNTIIAQAGETINWEINRVGYISQSGSDILTENMTKKITLEALEFTFTINQTPSEAIVILNGEEINTITVNYGTVVNWEVSLEGYSSQSGYLTVNEDTVLDIVLEESVNEFIANTYTIGYLLNGDLYGTGSNDHGQQGLGTSGSSTTATSFHKMAENIKDYAYSSYQTWYVDQNDDLYGCGYNKYGQQGSGDTTDVLTFTKRAENVKKVFTDMMNVSYYIDNNNNLYGCGYNAYGQMGLGHKNQVNTFTKLAENVKDLFLPNNDEGHNTLWYLDMDDNIWVCGNNSTYAQGNGTTTSTTSFSQRTDIQNVKKLYPQYNCTLYLDTFGNLYGCGYNGYGNMGNGNTSPVTTFTKLAENVKDFGGSYKVTWYLTNNGDLYGCGDNEWGQQGSGDTTDVLTFTKRAENVKEFSCTPYTTWYVTKDGDLYIVGYNNDGQHGSGNTDKVLTFTKRAENVKHVYGAMYASYYIDNNNDLYAAGDDSHGQQANGSNSSADVMTFTKILEGLNI